MSDKGSTRKSLKRRMCPELGRPVERDAGAGAVAEAVQVSEVRDPLVDGEGLLVRRREGTPEAVHEAVADLLAVRGPERVAEAVGPRAAHLDEALLEGLLLGAVEGSHPPAPGHADDELDARQARLADPRRELDGLAAEGVLEDVGHAQADAVL